jgi:hypothetical protein
MTIRSHELDLFGIRSWLLELSPRGDACMVLSHIDLAQKLFEEAALREQVEGMVNLGLLLVREREQGDLIICVFAPKSIGVCHQGKACFLEIVVGKKEAY